MYVQQVARSCTVLWAFAKNERATLRKASSEIASGTEDDLYMFLVIEI